MMRKKKDRAEGIPPGFPKKEPKPPDRLQKRVLIVERDPELSRLLSLFAEKKGMDAVIAKDSGDALEKFRTGGADLVLSGFQLSPMNGLQLMAEIRKLSSKAKMVLLTSGVDPEEKKKLQDLGVDAIIEKPFIIEPLSRILDD
ncbi:response regulator [Candidatus Micrarchaeota archaeon]|nr:response regulator [Candidatus Micrarchaeota archaeon]